MVWVSREGYKLLGIFWAGPGTERVKSRGEGRRVKSSSSFRHSLQRLAQLWARMKERFLGILGGKPRVCFQGRPGVDTWSKDHYSMSLNKSTQTALHGCPALIFEVVRVCYEDLEKLKKTRVKVIHISSYSLKNDRKYFTTLSFLYVGCCRKAEKLDLHN